MIRITKQTYDLDAFFAGFFVHLIGAGFVPYGDAGRKGEGFFFSFIGLADGGVGGWLDTLSNIACVATLALALTKSFKSLFWISVMPPAISRNFNFRP